MTTVVLTGFERFGDLRSNASEALVTEVAAAGWDGGDVRLAAFVLPTEFGRAGQAVVDLIGRHRPDVLLCCGVARRRSMPCIELAAWNRDDCIDPDNRGERRSSAPIIAAGPAWYRATLPIQRISRAWSTQGIPHGYSDNGGGFVCNHVFYHASHAIASNRIPAACGFIHWPVDAMQRAAAARSVEALRLCVQEAVSVAGGSGASRRAAQADAARRTLEDQTTSTLRSRRAEL